MKQIAPKYEVSKRRVMVVARNLSDDRCVGGMIPAANLAIMLIHSIGAGVFTADQAFDALQELAERQAGCGNDAANAIQQAAQAADGADAAEQERRDHLFDTSIAMGSNG